MREVLDELSTQISGYLEVWYRFFSVFKRDTLKETLSGTDADCSKRERVSSLRSHAVDAHVFIEGHRTDE